MAFDEAAVDTLYDKLLSHAAATGYFEAVNQHEPKSPPSNGVTAALWFQEIGPVPRGSGLAATSGQVICVLRVIQNFMSEPFDAIDPAVTKAVSSMMAAYTADLTLGGTVRTIDALGMYGTQLKARAGYITLDKTVYRVVDLTIPVIINDMFAQAQGG